MAKIAFSKLKCKINDSIKEVKLNDEITIEVKQYLPIQEKLALISRVTEYAHMQDTNYSNPVKASIVRDMEIIYAYTNIVFTDKQKEDIPKLYDILYSSGYLVKIIEAIPEEEYEMIVKGVKDSIDAIYQYLNSVVGIIDTISKSQENMALDVNAVQEGLAKLQESPLVKEIMPLIGLE